MEIKIGQFGRFWDGDRPSDYTRYFYGYFKGMHEIGYYVSHHGALWQHFEPADPQPQWTARRRVIADPAELNRVLLDTGYVPTQYCNFRLEKMERDGFLFLSKMFAFCGEPVKMVNGVYVIDVDDPNNQYVMRPEWTEEY